MKKSRLVVCLFVLLPGLLCAQTRDPSVYGRAYLAEGENAAAIESFQDANRLNPFDPVALNNLGVAHAAAGDYQSALELFARAVKLAPNRRDIGENHRYLLTWMAGERRGGIGEKSAPSIQAGLTNTDLGRYTPEPPALWQVHGKKSPQPQITLTTETVPAMSARPEKKRKTRKIKRRMTRASIVAAP